MSPCGMLFRTGQGGSEYAENAFVSWLPLRALMGDLRFAAPPLRKGPNKALLAAGLVVLLAAAFGLGRLWTRPPAPETAAAPAPTASPADPAAAGAAAAPLPGVTPTSASVPTPQRIQASSEVFQITRRPLSAAPAPAAAPTAMPEPTKPETLARQIARCLSFTVTRDNMFTSTSGVRVIVKAQNHCGQTFPGWEARFEIRAMAANGTGLAGRERGIFQTTIPPFGAAETIIVVPGDADAAYRFEVEIL